MSKTNKNAIIFSDFLVIVIIKEMQKDVIDSFEIKNVIITFKSISD